MSDALMNTTLAILAGGEGSRMGKPKGLLTVGGRPILKHILENAHWPGPTLLITSPGRQSPLGVEAFDAEALDPVAGLGPMRGILTALEHAKTEQVVVSAVDMPSLGPEIFRWLAGELHRRPAAHAIMIERMSGHARVVEPLPAAFRKTAAKLLEPRLADGQASLHRLAGLDGVVLVQAPESWGPELWTNLNFPGDLENWHANKR
jgi:molybdopterin-guanine dinucleotide biosynthesis protein A